MNEILLNFLWNFAFFSFFSWPTKTICLNWLIKTVLLTYLRYGFLFSIIFLQTDRFWTKNWIFCLFWNFSTLISSKIFSLLCSPNFGIAIHWSNKRTWIFFRKERRNFPSQSFLFMKNSKTFLGKKLQVLWLTNSTPFQNWKTYQVIAYFWIFFYKKQNKF